jgi:DNA (cytosine-5)-methyltransferase 1
MKAIDLFAGAGGFSEGAKQAGCQIVWAANHWKLAVDFHSANHPETAHTCQDLRQADWRDVPAHELLLASPACQGFTPARGKEKPHHDALRSTAWAVVDCAEQHREPLAVVENVPDFLNWGLYPCWEDAMRRLGYSISPHIIDAADHGVPQHRTRAFIVCTRSKHPLKLNLAPQPHQPVAKIIEWGRHKWNPVNRPGRSPKTLARIAAGRAEHGKRFVAPYYSSGSGLKGRSIDRPIGTITTIDRWAVVDGDRMRMLQPTEICAAMGFPRTYIYPKNRREAIHMFGNAVCPPAVKDILTELKRVA